MNAKSIGIVALGLFMFPSVDAQAQLAEPGSQAVNISVAGRTSDGPGNMINNGLARFQDFKNHAFGGTNITAVAVVADPITLAVAEAVSELMTTLNLLLLGYQQSVLAEFALDSDNDGPAVTDTTGSIGSDSLDDFFGDISGGS